DPIRADLILRKLDNFPEYDAISYTWTDESGDSTKSGIVYIGSIPFGVTRNCEDALRRVRQRFSKTMVWIDAICIDQENDEDRGHQVRIMPLIYAGAKRVIIYVGEPIWWYEEDLLGYLERFHTRNKSIPEYQLSESITRHTPARVGKGLRNLFQRRYFSRMWILKEVGLSARRTLVCGKFAIPWEKFAPPMLRELGLMHNPTTGSSRTA
ncbi:heterokaryon incompatibility protein-domain-containing protein, partial [Ilyonectria destructans]